MIMSVFVRRGDDDVGELECVKDGGELGAAPPRSAFDSTFAHNGASP